MEKKLIALVFVALLGGLGGGYGLGYVIFQPQIQNLQKDMDNQVVDLQNQIDQKDSQIVILQHKVGDLETLMLTMKRGDWNLLRTFQGSTIEEDYFQTALFYVFVGTEIRISWTLSPTEPHTYIGFPRLSVYLHKQGQSDYVEAFPHLQNDGYNTVDIIEPDLYYLGISTFNVQWTVTVEIWIPE